MNKSLTIFLFFLIFSASFINFSCKKQKEEPVVFDSSYPLALAPDVHWALVTAPYAAFRLNPSWDSEISANCRSGEVLQVMGFCQTKNKEKNDSYTKWYLFEQGWLSAESISVYSNRYKAQKAGEKFNK